MSRQLAGRKREGKIKMVREVKGNIKKLSRAKDYRWIFTGQAELVLTLFKVALPNRQHDYQFIIEMIENKPLPYC